MRAYRIFNSARSAKPAPNQRSLFQSQARYISSHRKPPTRIPASFYRGGTSKALIFHQKDLPQQRAEWAPILRSAIGSPDPEHGRQLDGMGGGLSSLSKVCVIRSSSDRKADVDYTFAAIGVKDDEVDYSSNCGNMSSAVGPFALESGIVQAVDGNEEATVRIRNTNTGKYIHATFPVDEEGNAATYGEFAIDGVTGMAGKIKLSFLDPSGSKTGKLLPTAKPVDDFEGVPATCIDVGNPCVFVPASALGVDGHISPDDISTHPGLLQKLDSIRRKAGVAMGLAPSEAKVPGSIPKIGMISPGQIGPDGKTLKSDIVVRALSVGQPHKAVPITVAMALAGAITIPGSTAHSVGQQTNGASPDEDGVTIAHPTGKLLVSSTLDKTTGTIIETSVFRTARLLMKGEVYVRE